MNLHVDLSCPALVRAFNAPLAPGWTTIKVGRGQSFSMRIMTFEEAYIESIVSRKPRSREMQAAEIILHACRLETAILGRPEFFTKAAYRRVVNLHTEAQLLMLLAKGER